MNNKSDDDNAENKKNGKEKKKYHNEILSFIHHFYLTLHMRGTVSMRCLSLWMDK